MVIPLGYIFVQTTINNSEKIGDIIYYSMFLTEAVGLLIFVKLILVMAEKPSLDKNRAAFTYYKKIMSCYPKYYVN